jgi:hypothetical protein
MVIARTPTESAISPNPPDSRLAGWAKQRNAPRADLTAESAVLVFWVLVFHPSIPTPGPCHRLQSVGEGVLSPMGFEAAKSIPEARTLSPG